MRLQSKKKSLQKLSIYLLRCSMTKKGQYTDHVRWALTKICFGIIGFFCILNIYLETRAEDLLEKAFYPAKVQETIIDLWNTKNAVGNEILREWVWLDANLLKWCVVNEQKILIKAVQKQMSDAWFNWTESVFCTDVLWGTWEDQVINAPETTTQAPFIVRIAKRLLRLTIVLSITMVIYNGVMYIVESAKWGEVKNATKNIMLIVWWILVALLSLGIINLISSISISTLQ